MVSVVSPMKNVRVQTEGGWTLAEKLKISIWFLIQFVGT